MQGSEGGSRSKEEGGRKWEEARSEVVECECAKVNGKSVCLSSCLLGLAWKERVQVTARYRCPAHGEVGCPHPRRCAVQPWLRDVSMACIGAGSWVVLEGDQSAAWYTYASHRDQGLAAAGFAPRAVHLSQKKMINYNKLSFGVARDEETFHRFRRSPMAAALGTGSFAKRHFSCDPQPRMTRN